VLKKTILKKKGTLRERSNRNKKKKKTQTNTRQSKIRKKVGPRPEVVLWHREMVPNHNAGHKEGDSEKKGIENSEQVERP